MDVSPFLNTVFKPEIFKPAGPEPEGFLIMIIKAVKPIVNDYVDYADYISRRIIQLDRAGAPFPACRQPSLGGYLLQGLLR